MKYNEHRCDLDDLGAYEGLRQAVRPVDVEGSVSPEIHEVVVAFTLASRVAAGHIMLCGYNVDSKPGSGKK